MFPSFSAVTTVNGGGKTIGKTSQWYSTFSATYDWEKQNKVRCITEGYICNLHILFKIQKIIIYM